MGDGGAGGERPCRVTCSGSARSTTSSAASSSASTRSTARCRRGSAATGWRSCPTRTAAGASTWPRRAARDADEPLMDGCPCPACAAGLLAAPTSTTCSRARELTALRLLTLHNLAFIARADGRPAPAIAAGRWPRPRRRSAPAPRRAQAPSVPNPPRTPGGRVPRAALGRGNGAARRIPVRPAVAAPHTRAETALGLVRLDFADDLAMPARRAPASARDWKRRPPKRSGIADRGTTMRRARRSIPRSTPRAASATGSPRAKIAAAGVQSPGPLDWALREGSRVMSVSMKPK